MTKRMFIFRSWLLFVLGMIAAGCDDTSLEPPAKETGTLTGYVFLHDDNGKRLTDHSGVRVQIEDPSISAVTDASGRYDLKEVPAGIYDVTYSKEGYLSDRSEQFQFIGVDTLRLIYRAMYPEAELRTFTLSQPEVAGGVITLLATVDPPGRRTYLSLTLSRQPGADIKDRATYFDNFTFINQIDTSEYLYLDAGYLKEYGFGSGDQVYVIAWTTSYNNVPNGLHSNEVSFIMP